MLRRSRSRSNPAWIRAAAPGRPGPLGDWASQPSPGVRQHHVGRARVGPFQVFAHLMTQKALEAATVQVGDSDRETQGRFTWDEREPANSLPETGPGSGQMERKNRAPGLGRDGRGPGRGRPADPPVGPPGPVPRRAGGGVGALEAAPRRGPGDRLDPPGPPAGPGPVPARGGLRRLLPVGGGGPLAGALKREMVADLLSRQLPGCPGLALAGGAPEAPAGTGSSCTGTAGSWASTAGTATRWCRWPAAPRPPSPVRAIPRLKEALEARVLSPRSQRWELATGTPAGDVFAVAERPGLAAGAGRLARHHRSGQPQLGPPCSGTGRRLLPGLPRLGLVRLRRDPGALEPPRRHPVRPLWRGGFLLRPAGRPIPPADPGGERRSGRGMGPRQPGGAGPGSALPGRGRPGIGWFRPAWAPPTT